MQKILDSLTEVSLIYSKTILDQLKKILDKKKDKYLKAINILKNLTTSPDYIALRNKLIAQVNYDIQKKCHPKPLYETSPTVNILVHGITHSINKNNLTNFKETITADYEEPTDETINLPTINDPLPFSQLPMDTLPEEEEDNEQGTLIPINHLNPDLNTALKNISNELKNLTHTVTMLKKDTTFLMGNSTRHSSSSSRGSPEESGNKIRIDNGNKNSYNSYSHNSPPPPSPLISPKKDYIHFTGQRNRNYNVGRSYYNSDNRDQRENVAQRNFVQKRDYNGDQREYGYNPYPGTRNSGSKIRYGTRNFESNNAYAGNNTQARNNTPPRIYSPPRNGYPRTYNYNNPWNYNRSMNPDLKYEDPKYENFYIRDNYSKNRESYPRNRDTPSRPRNF